jgi:pimeloyl-ACP methyl ester carboxylesterase
MEPTPETSDDETPPEAVHRSRWRMAIRAAGAGSFGFAGAGLTELSHRRRLATDPEYRRLQHPLSGQGVTARSADGTAIYAEVFGSNDAPTFVLAPGWTETLAYFDSITRELVEEGYRVVAYDLRGQGRSAVPTARGDWDIDRYGEDLEAVLARTCDGRDDVIVAGHSMGAMAIAAWARHHDVEARARGAMLMNTGLSGLVLATKLLPAVLPGMVAEPLARWTFMGNAMPMPPISTAISRAVIRYVAFGPYASDAEVDFYERMLMTCPPQVRAHAGMAMTHMDLIDAVERITIPTLVLSGRLDKLTPPVHAERIAEGLPRLIRLVELPGIGHMGPLESPHDLVMALLDVAASTIGAGADAPLAPVA